MRRVHNTGDFAAGIFFAAVAATVLALSRNYDFGTVRAIGPGFFPTIVAAPLALLGIVLILRAFRGQDDEAPELRLRPMLLILAGSLSFALLVRPAGFAAAIVVMVLIGCASAAGASFRVSLATAIILAAGSVAIFVMALGLPIPIFGTWLSG